MKNKLLEILAALIGGAIIGVVVCAIAFFVGLLWAASKISFLFGMGLLG